MDHLISRPTWETTLPTAGPDPLATAAPTPWLSQMLMPRGDALWPRFTTWYGELQAWPRRLRRALQRRLALPLAGVALLLALSQAPSLAATIVVDGTTCTLVDAITAANTDTAQGSCPAGSGADTLVLAPPGRMVMLTDVDNTTYGPTGLPVIRSAITIAGQGGTIARAPTAPPFRLLAVNGAGDLTLQDVTLTGGAAAGSFPAGDGGGVFNYNGTVTIDDSIITGNAADYGGGVSNRGDGTTLTLVRSTITGNTATFSGGGLDNAGDYYAPSSVTVTLTQSTISANTAAVGGGMRNLGDYSYITVMLTQSTISGNTATASGGGLVNGSHRYGGSVRVTLTQSTIAGNASEGIGGGMSNGQSSITLTQSTISGNTAARGGGGHFTVYGFVSLTDSTITGNTAGRFGGGGAFFGYNGVLSLTRSLVAGNLAPSAPELEVRGDVRANAFNLFGVNGDAGVVGFTPGPTDLVPDVPLTAILDPVLADHGGPTLTHALVPSSPARDAILLGTQGCGTTVFSDQRGQARPQPAGGACDIGAFEVGVAGQPLGAWVSGLTPHTVVCTNLTTGQAVTLSAPASAWDCEAAGLEVRAGEQVVMRVRGTVEAGAPDVGGAVTGLQPQSARCTNLTTGQQVPFEKMRGATAGSCGEAGLAIQPGDRLQLRVQGTAE